MASGTDDTGLFGGHSCWWRTTGSMISELDNANISRGKAITSRSGEAGLWTAEISPCCSPIYSGKTRTEDPDGLEEDVSAASCHEDDIRTGSVRRRFSTFHHDRFYWKQFLSRLISRVTNVRLHSLTHTHTQTYTRTHTYTHTCWGRWAGKREDGEWYRPKYTIMNR